MAAVGGPLVQLGNVGVAPLAPPPLLAAPLAPPPLLAAPLVAGPAALGPRNFNMGAVLAPIGMALAFAIPGYELPWENYNTLLRENLTAEYQTRAVEPPAARVPAVPAAAAPAGADLVGVEIGRMNAYIKANRPPSWSNNNISNLLRNARAAVVTPYDPAHPAPYRAAFNAFLDVAANQRAAGVLAGGVVGHVNIGP